VPILVTGGAGFIALRAEEAARFRFAHVSTDEVFGSADDGAPFSEEHASAILAVLARGRRGETYAIGGDAERRNIGVIHAICDVVDEPRPDPALGSRRTLVTHVTDLRYAVDASKLRRELGWAPAESFGRGVRRTVRW
jgi:dTDP-glucose 4,6-dehydratase